MYSHIKIFVFIATLLTSLLSIAIPGDLVSLTHLQDVDAAQVATGRKIFCPATANIKKAFGFKIYRAEYSTTDSKGQSVVTAGIIIVPQVAEKLPLFVYQHGTLIGRSELPSNNNSFSEGMAVGICVTSLGYVSILADYIGYGDSTGVHPYLHADSEAWTARDLMRATLVATSQASFKLNSQIFIAGYSQGGHAAMSLLQLLEQDKTREFTVTAAAPMAGPYNLTRSMLELAKHPAPHSAAEGAYVIAGLNPIYGFFNSLNEAIQAPHVALVSSFFDGSHSFSEVRSQFGMPMEQLFQSSFLKADLQNPSSKFRKALAANDLHRWIPRTPLRLYHGGGDVEVPFFNAQDAHDYMKAGGANVKIINLGSKVTHQGGFRPSLEKAAVWFESFQSPHFPTVR